MSVAVREVQPATADRTPEVQRRLGRLEWTTAVAGACIAVLAGFDGSPVWQAARVLAVGAFTAVLVAVELRAPRWRGWVAALAAMPALATAVGFAPHLVKGGPILVQAASLILAVASLGLLVGGAVLVIQDRGLVRRLATAAGLVVATGVTLLVVGPAVVVTNTPRPEIADLPSSVGLVYEDVVLDAGDGVDLAAWYVPSSNGAAVVLLHGAGSTRSDVLDQAAVLARAGFGVLMLDARGHGDSGGRAMDFGWHGDADVAAATGFLAGRPDVDSERIGAVGMSMGGEQALGAAGSNDLIRAVVAEGATARAAGDEAWLSDEYGLRGWVQEQLERLQDRVTDLLTTASPPGSMRASVAAASGTRVLLITAGSVAQEGHAAEFIAVAAPDRVDIWTVEGAGHTAGLETEPGEWTDRVIGFLTDALLRPR